MSIKKRIRLFTLLITAGFISPVTAAELASYEVSTATVTRERLFDGVMEAMKQTTVSAQTSGRITEINFDIDDYVEQDAILIRISNDEQTARVAQTAAAINEAGAQLGLAEANYQRFKALLASNTIPQSQFDDAKTALQRARASLENAQAAHEEAQKQLEYTVVRAPYSGIVTARLAELGEAVSPGTPLMSGFSLKQLRVRTEVPNRFTQQIDVANGVDVILDTRPVQRIHSTHVTIFPFANPRSNSITVRAELPEHIAGIYPGMLTKVAFETFRINRVLIPQSAVFTRSELTGVYVLDGERIVLRRVRIGLNHPAQDGEKMVEILSGLIPGEKIARDPVAAVRQMKADQAQAEQ